MGGRSTGFAIPLVLGLWLAGVIFALGNIPDDGTGATAPAPGQTPVPLPTAVVVGRTLDPNTGQVSDPVSRFESHETIAFSVWLGTPYGASKAVVALAHLEPDGFHIVGGTGEVTVDPDSPVVAGQFAADILMDRAGAGTYLVDVQRPSGDRIGYGVVQLETETPEAIELFVEGWRAATIAAGEHTGYQFGRDGEVVAELTQTLNEDVSLWSNHRATFAGRDYLFMVEGPWANHYLPESGGARLADESG